MDEIVIAVRPALITDVDEIVLVHDAAWRAAYRGIIPGQELERIVSRRGASWWRSAILRGSGLLVFEFGGKVAGYVSFGRNRTKTPPYTGEIFELYVSPTHQGLGLARFFFKAPDADSRRMGTVQRSSGHWRITPMPRGSTMRSGAVLSARRMKASEQ